MYNKIDEIVMSILTFMAWWAQGVLLITLFLTFPVWIIPYVIYRKLRQGNRKGDENNE